MIIIHNVINDKVFFIYSFWLIHSLESLHSDYFDGERLLYHFLSNCRYLQLIWRYLQIGRIWRYLQINCRYLQMNCRYLQIGLFVDISNWFGDIFNWIGDISNSIEDIFNSFGDIFNSVNKCENGAPYEWATSKNFKIMNIQFQKKAGRRWTRRSPDGHTKNGIDYSHCDWQTEHGYRRDHHKPYQHWKWSQDGNGQCYTIHQSGKEEAPKQEYINRVDTQMIGTKKNTFQLELKNRFTALEELKWSNKVRWA